MRVGDENFEGPRGARADVDGGAHTILLQHDITLYRRRRLILARLDDAVVGRRARA